MHEFPVGVCDATRGVNMFYYSAGVFSILFLLYLASSRRTQEKGKRLSHITGYEQGAGLRLEFKFKDFIPSECAKECKWAKDCRRFSKGNNNRTVIAGISHSSKNTELFCCQYDSISFVDCRVEDNIIRKDIHIGIPKRIVIQNIQFLDMNRNMIMDVCEVRVDPTHACHRNSDRTDEEID